MLQQLFDAVDKAETSRDFSLEPTVTYEQGKMVAYRTAIIFVTDKMTRESIYGTKAESWDLAWIGCGPTAFVISKRAFPAGNLPQD